MPRVLPMELTRTRLAGAGVSAHARPHPRLDHVDILGSQATDGAKVTSPARQGVKDQSDQSAARRTVDQSVAGQHLAGVRWSYPVESLQQEDPADQGPGQRTVRGAAPRCVRVVRLAQGLLDAVQPSTDGRRRNVQLLIRLGIAGLLGVGVPLDEGEELTGRFVMAHCWGASGCYRPILLLRDIWLSRRSDLVRARIPRRCIPKPPTSRSIATARDPTRASTEPKLRAAVCPLRTTRHAACTIAWRRERIAARQHDWMLRHSAVVVLRISAANEPSGHNPPHVRRCRRAARCA